MAEATWQAEAAKWDHLKALRIETVLGTALQRKAALCHPADIYITNRENTQWLCDWFTNPEDAPVEFRSWPFDMVVIDESSSFKNPAAKRFKALKKMLPRIDRLVILTGTPAPNGIEDLWSQIYLLDRGQRLGAYVTHYRERYFDHNPWRHEYTPKPGAFEAVQAKIADLCVSMTAADYLQLPDLITDDVPVALSPEAAKAYRKLEREMVLEVAAPAPCHPERSEGSSPPVEISATTAAALTNKLLQLCGGNLYDESGTARHVHDAKAEALTELVEQIHAPVLIFYAYKHEIPVIEAALQKAPPPGGLSAEQTGGVAPPPGGLSANQTGGVRLRRLESAADADAWNRGEVDVLLAHPASCAYGLNLQAGGPHVIWYTLTWSLELYQQANARLHRQGQQKPVIVHRLLVTGGADEDVARALEAKTDTQAALIDALKARINSHA